MVAVHVDAVVFLLGITVGNEPGGDYDRYFIEFEHDVELAACGGRSFGYAQASKSFGGMAILLTAMVHPCWRNQAYVSARCSRISSVSCLGEGLAQAGDCDDSRSWSDAADGV